SHTKCHFYERLELSHNSKGRSDRFGGSQVEGVEVVLVHSHGRSPPYNANEELAYAITLGFLTSLPWFVFSPPCRANEESPHVHEELA
ncbi:unnamed protein product, partial [Sphenostylis stenocarpa]